MKLIGIRQDITSALPLQEITGTLKTALQILREGQVLVSGVRSMKFDTYMDYCIATEELQIIESIGDLVQQKIAASKHGQFSQQHWYTASLDDCLRASGDQIAA